ncbi:LON peptidase N-terminal domain and RING finger protein 3 [Halocaridina rubra]|uniref:LON peptidase N-terminal domain and RING finger protein 3 n=1 Tax=Halocaridina rubra TaxID=373956 RepID=A0AAN8WLU5_HALRR
MSATDTVERSTLGLIFSKDVYERLLQENGPNIDVYLAYATYLGQNGNVTESLEVLCHIYRIYSMSTEKLFPVVSKIIQYLRADSRENSSPPLRNVFSCPCCWGVLHEPMTLQCGHSYCRRCLLKENLKTCRVCQSKLKNFSPTALKNSVLITTLVDRWWSGEVDGVKLRSRGNECFKMQDLERAVNLYTEAVDYAPQDHLLLSNRSHVLHTLGRAEEALKDADAAIQCQPEWAKGYFRRAMALISLGRYEDAFVALLQCAILEESNSLRSIKEEITKALHRLLGRLTAGRRLNVEGRVNRLMKGFPRLTPAISDPAIPFVSDSEDSEDSEDCRRQRHSEATALAIEEVPQIRKIIDRFNLERDRRKKMSTGYVRQVDSLDFDKNEFECTLCFRYLYQPVTTPCGHCFCRTCLDRCLDHSTNCPLCKTSIKVYLAERRSAITEFVEVAMQTVMPSECVDRRRQHEEELEELANAGKDRHHEIPIFVATIAIPTITCPLHVFEPRYRLMIRRCMESGTREFGMCLPMDNAKNGYADYGTMLEIRDVEYTSDGRSIVNTVGSRRFKIESKGFKDGYNTATVEFLEDDEVSPECLGETRRLHDTVNQVASSWFESIESTTKRRILGHYGPMPPVEVEYWTLPNGPTWMWWIVAILPLDSRIQLSVLRETSIRRRLEIIRCILKCVMSQQRACQVAAAPQ